MICGAPGVVKSQAVRETAKNIEYKTCKEVNIPTIWVVTEKMKSPFGKIVRYNKE